MFLIAMLLAASDPQPSPSTPPAATVTSPEDKVICYREGATESRIRTKKICRKQSEWSQIAKEAEDDMKRSSNQRSNPGNTPGS